MCPFRQQLDFLLIALAVREEGEVWRHHNEQRVPGGYPKLYSARVLLMIEIEMCSHQNPYLVREGEHKK